MSKRSRNFLQRLVFLVVLFIFISSNLAVAAPPANQVWRPIRFTSKFEEVYFPKVSKKAGEAITARGKTVEAYEEADLNFRDREIIISDPVRIARLNRVIERMWRQAGNTKPAPLFNAKKPAKLKWKQFIGAQSTVKYSIGLRQGYPRSEIYHQTKIVLNNPLSTAASAAANKNFAEERIGLTAEMQALIDKDPADKKFGTGVAYSLEKVVSKQEPVSTYGEAFWLRTNPSNQTENPTGNLTLMVNATGGPTSYNFPSLRSVASKKPADTFQSRANVFDFIKNPAQFFQKLFALGRVSKNNQSQLAALPATIPGGGDEFLAKCTLGEALTIAEDYLDLVNIMNYLYWMVGDSLDEIRIDGTIILQPASDEMSAVVQIMTDGWNTRAGFDINNLADQIDFSIKNAANDIALNIENIVSMGIDLKPGTVDTIISRLELPAYLKQSLIEAIELYPEKPVKEIIKLQLLAMTIRNASDVYGPQFRKLENCIGKLSKDAAKVTSKILERLRILKAKLGAKTTLASAAKLIELDQAKYLCKKVSPTLEDLGDIKTGKGGRCFWAPLGLGFLISLGLQAISGEVSVVEAGIDAIEPLPGVTTIGGVILGGTPLGEGSEQPVPKCEFTREQLRVILNDPVVQGMLILLAEESGMNRREIADTIESYLIKGRVPGETWEKLLQCTGYKLDCKPDGGLKLKLNESGTYYAESQNYKPSELTWDAPGGNPSQQEGGATFTTRYATEGVKSIKLSSNSSLAKRGIIMEDYCSALVEEAPLACEPKVISGLRIGQEATIRVPSYGNPPAHVGAPPYKWTVSGGLQKISESGTDKNAVTVKTTGYGTETVIVKDARGRTETCKLEIPETFSTLKCNGARSGTPGYYDYAKSGGRGSFSWTAAGGTPASGSGEAIRIHFGKPGSYTITVNDTYGGRASCQLNVFESAVQPACRNGRDDDGDGKTDYPADPGCCSLDEHDERDGACVPFNAQPN